MKKSTLLKLTLTLFCASLITGLIAQPTTIKTNYVNNVETIYQTTGQAFTLYVLPDLTFSPSYATTGNSDNSGINTTSQWRWEANGTAWGVGTSVAQDWTTGKNWIKVLTTDPFYPTEGASLILRVKERFGAANCESANEQTKTITIVSQPAITVFSGAGTGWVPVVAGTEYKYCGEGLTDALGITLTEASMADATLQKYTYGITCKRTCYDGNMLPISVALTDEDVTTTMSMGKTASTNGTGYVAGLSQTFTTPAMNMYMLAAVKYPTKFVYSITPTSLRSQVSRLSHYRATDSDSDAPYNNVIATTITYWLYPTPTTGPIYHIPNNFTY